MWKNVIRCLLSLPVLFGLMLGLIFSFDAPSLTTNLQVAAPIVLLGGLLLYLIWRKW